MTQVYVTDVCTNLAAILGFNLDSLNSRWFPPPSVFHKLNVDGCVREGCAVYGGLLRTIEGLWEWGFTGKCGFVSALEEKLRVIKEGLLAVQRIGLLMVILKSNSSEAVNMLNGYPNEDYPLLTLILECKPLHGYIWSSSITYVPCNYNYNAGFLAKLAHNVYNNVDFVWFGVGLPYVWRKCIKIV